MRNKLLTVIPVLSFLIYTPALAQIEIDPAPPPPPLPVSILSVSTKTNSQISATGIIGRKMKEKDGHTVGVAQDIIMDDKGKAKAILVMDENNHLNACDYGMATQPMPDGDILVPLSSPAISSVRPFSYTEPGFRLSVKELLGGYLADNTGAIVAKTSNIHFKNGYADQVIFSFDSSEEGDEKKAVLDFKNLRLVSVNGSYRFLMNKDMSQKFLSYSGNS